MQHNFSRDFPSPEVAADVLSTMFSHPSFFCVVAERGGKIIGSNCVDERTPVAGIGPLSVDPRAQDHGTGRQLMQAILAQAQEKKFTAIRLMQAGYHNRTLALYAKLGFVVREPLVCMQGPAIRKTPPGYRVRPARAVDLAACNELCVRVHGHDRGGQLVDAIDDGTAVVAEFDGRIRAYSASVDYFGHTVGEGDRDVQALIATAPEFRGMGILIPTRRAELFRWCLESGLRVVQSLTLMTIGLYNEPAGSYLASVVF
jgi:GNAT superfamily N-acetyltransferase